jgi:hypothetical protein
MVKSFEDIPVSKTLPWLLASKQWHAKRIAQQSAGSRSTVRRSRSSQRQRSAPVEN